jgi:hypothetical protein
MGLSGLFTGLSQMSRTSVNGQEAVFPFVPLLSQEYSFTKAVISSARTPSTLEHTYMAV